LARPGLARPGLAYSAACAVGVAGLGFHAYNLLRRPGGLSWGNLFYAAPVGAPAALSLAGLLGLAARRVESGSPTIAALPSGQAAGWSNWSQHLLSGPPLPAPPSFSALALAGRAALTLRMRDAA